MIFLDGIFLAIWESTLTEFFELIKLSRLSLEKGGRLILDKVDLSVRQGEIVTVIGPNGAGKTSLVKVLTGLEKPTSGIIHGVPNLVVGYMPQRVHIDHTMPLTVARFLRLVREVSDSKRDDVLNLVKAQHLQQRMMVHLSGGELQRVLLARALLRSPQLLVLDEPAQGLDVTGQIELYSLIEQIRGSQGTAIVLISHDLHWVMAKTDQVICLNRHICCSGHPHLVSKEPAFRDLFGLPAGDGLAPYAHPHHDHTHF